jgi:hypothetical protein
VKRALQRWKLIDFVQVVRRRGRESSDEPWKERFGACIHALAKTEHDLQVIADILASERSPQGSK